MILKHCCLLRAKAYLKWTEAEWKMILWSEELESEFFFTEIILWTKEERDHLVYCQYCVQKLASLNVIWVYQCLWDRHTDIHSGKHGHVFEMCCCHQIQDSQFQHQTCFLCSIMNRMMLCTVCGFAFCFNLHFMSCFDFLKSRLQLVLCHCNIGQLL